MPMKREMGEKPMRSRHCDEGDLRLRCFIRYNAEKATESSVLKKNLGRRLKSIPPSQETCQTETCIIPGTVSSFGIGPR